MFKVGCLASDNPRGPRASGGGGGGGGARHVFNLCIDKPQVTYHAPHNSLAQITAEADDTD